MNAKMSALLALGLLLASCGPKGTEPPKTDGGTVTQPAPTPTPTPTPTPEPTPQPTPTPGQPYDASGSWTITTTMKTPYLQEPVAIPSITPLMVEMTNRATGEFKATAQNDSTAMTVLSGNTATGVVRFSAPPMANGTIAALICQGKFDTSANTYQGDCALEGMSLEDYKAMGLSTSILLKRQ